MSKIVTVLLSIVVLVLALVLLFSNGNGKGKENFQSETTSALHQNVQCDGFPNMEICIQHVMNRDNLAYCAARSKCCKDERICNTMNVAEVCSGRGGSVCN